MPTMQLNQFTAEIETQPGTLKAKPGDIGSAEETIKDLPLLAYGDTDTMIAYREDSCSSFYIFLDAEKHFATVWTVFYGVVHEISHYLLDTLDIEISSN